MIAFFMENPVENGTGAVEQHPEYNLIVQANQIAVEIDTEISIVHKVFLRFIPHHFIRYLVYSRFVCQEIS